MPAADVAIVAPFPVSAAANSLRSGVAAYTAQLAEALSTKGVAVRVIAPHAAGEPARSRVGDVTVERAFPMGLSALPRAAGAARRSGAAVVHFQHELFLFGGASAPGLLPALCSARGFGLGPVVTMHQVVEPKAVDREFVRVHRVRVPPRLARIGLDAMQRSVRSLAAATIVHENSFASVVPGARVTPHGVVRRRQMPSSEAKAALDLPGDRLIVLCFGFLAPYKGLEAALEAARLAADQVVLVVAGGEHPRLAGRDPYAAELRSRYRSVGRFTGFVPDADVARWFSAADLVLVPYPRPFATSGPFADALSYRTPVVCSPAFGACAAVPDQMVVPIDPPGLAAHLRALACDRGALDTVRAATESFAAGRSWDRVARDHIEIYEEVIHAESAPGRGVRTGKPG